MEPDYVDVEYFLPKQWSKEDVVQWLDRVWYGDVLDRKCETRTTIVCSSLLLFGEITLRTYFL